MAVGGIVNDSGSNCTHQNWLAGLNVLYFYGAAGLASFGAFFCHQLGFYSAPSEVLWPGLLWFAGALLIYNLDRVWPDSADALNTPARIVCSDSLRKIRFLVMFGAVLTLLLVPILLGQRLLLVLVISGGVACASYSVKIFGRRLKDIPVIKTLIVPTLIVASFLAPPLLNGRLPNSPSQFYLGVAWAWSILFFNMLLCDLRDIEGDRACGTISLPVFLGKPATRRLLVFLAGVIPVLALLLSWPWQAIASALYLGGLLLATRTPRPESFYDWWVEGLLFLPALVEGMRRLLGFLSAGT